MSTNELASNGFGLRLYLPLLQPGLRLGGRLADHSVRRLMRRIRLGRLEVTFPDGSRDTFEGDLGTAPAAALRIHDRAALARLLVKGDIGFAESYMDGHWDTPDLVSFMTLVKHNEDLWQKELDGGTMSRALNRVYHRLRDNHRRGSRRNIAYHYDLGNDFYARWLDATMTYSSALFDGDAPAPPREGRGDPETVGADALAAAQRRKYQRICELAGIDAGSEVLEVGCGWGGLLEHAARSTGCRVRGITLSREQLRYARERLAGAGLEGHAEVHLEDYRDTTGSYDAVVSIEMMEAVGEAHWPAYFATIRERLKPGASAVIQVITIADERFETYRARPDFIQRYIFPGGMLPSPSRLRAEAAAAGLELDHEETFGDSYARTLAAWRDRFQAAWPRLSGLGYDERFRRLWEYYLCYCETGFRDGVIDVGIYRYRRPE